METLEWGSVAVAADRKRYDLIIRNGQSNPASAKTFLRSFGLNFDPAAVSTVEGEVGGMTIPTATGTFRFDFSN